MPASVADLVQQLLKFNPRERLPLDQVLRHPWVLGRSLGDGDSEGSHEQLPEDVLQSQAEAVTQTQQDMHMPQSQLSGAQQPSPTHCHSSARQHRPILRQPKISQSLSERSLKSAQLQPAHQFGRVPHCDQVEASASPKLVAKDPIVHAVFTADTPNSTPLASTDAPAAQAHSSTFVRRPLTNRTVPRRSPWSSQANEIAAPAQPSVQHALSRTQMPMLPSQGVVPNQRSSVNSVAATWATQGSTASEANRASVFGGTSNCTPSAANAVSFRLGRCSTRENSCETLPVSRRTPMTTASLPPPDCRSGSLSFEAISLAEPSKSASMILGGRGSPHSFLRASPMHPRRKSGAAALVGQTGLTCGQAGSSWVRIAPASQPGSPNLTTPQITRSLSPSRHTGVAGAITGRALSSALHASACFSPPTNTVYRQVA
eukprot:TRINITY_DN33114_c0_g1_i1.p1 TRINITY_DN33114_c0_g1~~TRINITY_DN33114_c0_g1_i1.p1  ORF type:complete len:438 (+),score=30.97 TRINITY_DN33114_c0_g1_i1:26-1315(+)